MRILLNIKHSWGAIRWKMIFIFAFFSVISMILVACFAVAILNVVIRRESAYLMEERIKVIVDGRKKLTDALANRVSKCQGPASDSLLFSEYLDAPWPEGRSLISVLPKRAPHGASSTWHDTGSFVGIVADRGSLDIRSFRSVERDGCSVTILVRNPINTSFLDELSKAASLQISSSKPVLLGPYRTEEGVRGEIDANFIPGSRRPVPVVVIARNWQTGALEDWVVCQVRPTYSRTIEDLSHMGLRIASWVSPLGGIALALVIVYACGLRLSLRLSQRIVAVIDGLSHAAHRIGKGDFSVRVAVPEQDQLGILAASFNAMTQDLESLREQEKERAVLERDIVLAREAQQYLYPRAAPVLSTASVWGVTTPARIVSGDLYDFLPFSNTEVGLLCADVSGKGVPAALMMANLQAVAHGRLLGGANGRPTPDAFVAALNRDIRGRFGDSRYATMFYGEFDSRSSVLRYVSAGHCSPIFISDSGEATTLPGGDLPVGLFAEAAYQELRVTVSSGCAIVVYTDGVADALNSQGEAFGEERIRRYLTSLPKGANAEVICSQLAGRIHEWAAGVEQFDDTTILVLSVADPDHFSNGDLAARHLPSMRNLVSGRERWRLQ
jgi:serine phosphatase RsbU (regulator of sigma subunit)